jgi:hypothetical protein
MADKDFNINIRTTADTTGVKQTEAELARLQKEADKGAKETGASIGRLIAPFVTAFSAFKFVDQINTVAERLKQTSEELAKQGEQLVENGKHYAELAKSARDEGDVIKIAERALHDTEAAHKRVVAAQQEELTWWDKITDSVYHGLVNVASFNEATKDAGRIAKEALDLRVAGQEREEAIARQNLVSAIRSGEAYKEAFERRKAEPFAQAIKEITDQIAEQERILKSIDYTKFPESWLAAAKNIERSKSDLQEIVKLQEKAVSQTAKDIKGAPPQVQRILMNEQAARIATAEGRERDAELFTRSAEAFKRGATPQQLQQAAKLEGSKDIVEAINRLADLWK